MEASRGSVLFLISERARQSRMQRMFETIPWNCLTYHTGTSSCEGPLTKFPSAASRIARVGKYQRGETRMMNCRVSELNNHWFGFRELILILLFYTSCEKHKTKA